MILNHFAGDGKATVALKLDQLAIIPSPVTFVVATLKLLLGTKHIAQVRSRASHSTFSAWWPREGYAINFKPRRETRLR